MVVRKLNNKAIVILTIIFMISLETILISAKVSNITNLIITLYLSIIISMLLNKIKFKTKKELAHTRKSKS